ncbi:MAG TPA: flagellar basal body-associated protein FliL [Dongiaceae bacterium]|nr:flagellar basal body-associated protein FliL [Dongiaceae bacterium]
MAADKKEDAKESAEGAEKPKSKMMLIIIIALVVLLVGGGVAAFFILSGGDKDKKKEGEGEGDAEAEVQHVPAVYFDFKPPFIVNYQWNGRQRYVQISLSVMTRKEAVVEAIKKHMPLIRNNLVMVFSSQDFDMLRTPEGKEAVRTAALEEMQKIITEEMGEPGIEQVLFTNFVMQ